MLLVVEGKPKGIAKGGERPFHGVGLGLLRGTLMGLTWRGASPSAKTMSLPCDNVAFAGTNPHTHARHVGASAIWALRMLPDALEVQGLPVPGLKAKDAVGLRNRMPPLDIGQSSAIELPGSNVFGTELRP